MMATHFVIPLLFAATPFAVLLQEDTGKRQVAADVLQDATTLLLENHPRQFADRDVLARDWALRFLRALDPHRMHFLDSDVREFTADGATLITAAQRGNADFPLRVIRRFRQRLQANTRAIEQLLAAPHNFSIDESVPVRYDTAPASQADLRERWRLRVKYELLMERLNGSDDATSRKFVRGRYARIHEHYAAMSPMDTIALYADSLAKCFDSESAYFSDDFLNLFRVSHFPNYRLPLQVEYRAGDLWIRPLGRDAVGRGHRIDGHRIVAVRTTGQPVHLTGLPDGPALRTLISHIGELRNARSVVLELDDPRRGSRISVRCDRWMPGR